MADFLQELGQLTSALDGYPVHQLLGFMGDSSNSSTCGHRVVDSCLAGWIAALDVALDTMPSELDDSLVRIEVRQRGARDALVRLKSVLPRHEIVRPNGGQPC